MQISLYYINAFVGIYLM